MPTEIRRAAPVDAEVVRTMLGELADYQDEGAYVAVTVEQWRDLLRDDDVIVLLAEQDAATAGYVSAYSRCRVDFGRVRSTQGVKDTLSV